MKAGAAKAAAGAGAGVGVEAWAVAATAARPEWAWLEWLEAPALRPILRGKLRAHTAAARGSGDSLRPARRGAPANLPSPHGMSATGLRRANNAGPHGIDSW